MVLVTLDEPRTVIVTTYYFSKLIGMINKRCPINVIFLLNVSDLIVL